MINVFKDWINMILGVGIIFTIIRIIIPNTGLKKYINSLMGIVTIIVVLSPIINYIKIGNFSEDFSKILENLKIEDEIYVAKANYEDIQKDNLKSNFKSKMQTDIKENLNKNINSEVEVNIDISDEYNIENVKITIYENTPFDIKSYLSNRYSIEKEKIQIIKGG